MMRRVGLVAVGALLVACSDALSPRSVDTTAMVTGVDALTATFSANPAYRSLTVLSNFFPRYSLAAPAALAFDVQGAQALFPVDVLGRTLVWNADSAKYVVDKGLAGAPATGVRLLLYTVDPATDKPAVPLSPLGSVDLTDVSTAQANRLGVLLRTGSATLAQYTITSVAATTSIQVTLAGWISAADGGGRVNFDLTHFTDRTDTTLERHYALNAQSGSQVDYTLHATAAGSGTTVFRTLRGRDVIELSGTFTVDNDSGLVAFDGTPVALYRGVSDVATPTFTAAGSFALSAQQQVDLGDLFVVSQTIGTEISGLFGPAFTVFRSI